jgi:coproporphyrinogen III oxidase-like Fe-S oxidoreductase
MIAHLVRQLLLKLVTGESEIALSSRIPSRVELYDEFETIDALGLYLHIPFCEQICPYCPYNKELYRCDVAERYVHAVKREIDFYSDIVGQRPITSLYIGGGTPTTMLHSGLADIIGHIRDTFNLQCDIHMESHPNHLSADNLSMIMSMGIQHLSIGVEALLDRHLKTLRRPYTVDGVREAIGRASSQGFKCVNVDVMFALPGQTYEEIEQTGHALVEMGVDQVAAYPLFRFPYTRMGRTGKVNNYGLLQVLKRRRMFGILERIFYEAGYQRTSVWAFTRRGVPRYCSVTVPLYLGLGASGGSYLRGVFYLNTFSVSEYIKALENGRMAIALSVDLSERMQSSGWLYWRIYETRFRKADYQKRFGNDLDSACGGYLKLLALLGFLKDDGDWILLSDKGAFWLHACQDILSIDYISKLWGTSKRDPWPEKVIL